MKQNLTDVEFGGASAANQCCTETEKRTQTPECTVKIAGNFKKNIMETPNAEEIDDANDDAAALNEPADERNASCTGLRPRCSTMIAEDASQRTISSNKSNSSGKSKDSSVNSSIIELSPVHKFSNVSSLNCFYI